MRDPGNGLPWRKLQGWASNRDLSIVPLPCTCFEHGRIEGSIQEGARKGQLRSVVSGEYPPAMCRVLARVIASSAGSAQLGSRKTRKPETLVLRS